MEACGYENFPWEQRIEGLEGESTKTTAAFEDNRLLGYVEYCRDWKVLRLVPL